MNFHSLYDQGFARVAAVTVPVHPAQPLANAGEVIDAARELDAKGVATAVFPELGISGYAIDDLLLQDVVLDEVTEALHRIAAQTKDLLPILIVGAPIRNDGSLYNCAVTIHRGKILGVTPKLHLPNYREFYEKRHFATPGPTTPSFIDTTAWGFVDDDCASAFVPFSPITINVEDVPGLVIAPEVCEDMWVPLTPSTLAALNGATVLMNLSASPITVGRAEDRRLLVRSLSARLNSAYVYCASGAGESSTDLSWDGQTMVYEAGDLLAEGERFKAGGRQITIADVDLDRLVTERTRQNSFKDNADRYLGEDQGLKATAPMPVYTQLNPPRTDLGLERSVDRFPFVPDDPERLAQDCYEAYNIQVHGLVQRLKAIGNPKIVIGVSGGLDSTHALIVAARAMDMLGRPRTDILAYTMPGFATSDHTKSNAIALCESLDIPCQTIDIRPAARQLLADMGHPYADGNDTYDVTFENVQAGLRTDYLFRIANRNGGIVLGTGDLSELALGWCTYGVGDQMSHYAVNTGVPKTLIQHLIRWVVASGQFSDRAGEVLTSILGTEISPELVPAQPGEKMQSTQDKIGPYNLQDFTLYYVLRRGARPSKIAFLAEKAWADVNAGEWPAGFPESDRVAYSLEEIVKWETLFLRRYFTQQFKRSALPNGPKVVAGGALSPRGDWRMPSDVSGARWIAELEEAVAGIPNSGVPATQTKEN